MKEWCCIVLYPDFERYAAASSFCFSTSLSHASREELEKKCMNINAELCRQTEDKEAQLQVGAVANRCPLHEKYTRQLRRFV